MPMLRSRQRRLAALILLSVLATSCGGGEPMASIPPGLEPRVESARRSLEGHWEGLLRPSFTFLAARCRADGGVLVLFAQQGIGSGDLAIAMQGPGWLADAWSGGFGTIDPQTDPDIVAFFAQVREVPCPA
jgi:streptogramin lyase